MLHKLLLKPGILPVESSQSPRSTGKIWKIWARTHAAQMVDDPANPPERQTDPMKRLRALATGEKTAIMPEIKRPEMPRFIEYRRADNPLTMLYGAIIAAREQLGALPGTLYLSSNLLPQLLQAARVAHVALGDFSVRGIHFKFSTGSGLVSIPIRTENELPEIIRIVLNGEISRDSIIAVCA